MLEPILQQVAAGNPQIAQMIGQNSEQFLQLLSEEVGEDEEGSLPPGTQAISVTEEERDAIERVSLTLLPCSLCLADPPSCAVWVSLGIRSSRLTLPATRTKSLPPISSLTSRMTTRSKRFLFYLYVLMNTKHATVPHLAGAISSTLFALPMNLELVLRLPSSRFFLLRVDLP